MEIDLIAAGKRINQIRKQHNYSMALFSNLIGNSSASTVNNWEKGNNLPRQERLEKLAILGNTTVDWIRYGDFEDYVQQLLTSTDLSEELTSEQFEKLIQTLNKQKISYSQDLDILTTANDLFPHLFEKNYQLAQFQSKELLISEDSTAYHIEKNYRYRSDFLPIIEELLHTSTNKEINSTVFFQLFDLLKRSESNSYFPSIPQIIALLSQVLTNDIAYRSKPVSNVVEYSEMIKQQPSRKRLAENTINKNYRQTKEDILHLLDKFHSEYNVK